MFIVHSKYCFKALNKFTVIIALTSSYPGIAFLHHLQKKYTLIRQLLRSSLIRVYFICYVLHKNKQFTLQQHKHYSKRMIIFYILANNINEVSDEYG